MNSTMVFHSRSEAEHEAMRNALVGAATAFEMLRPENHDKTSNAELAALIAVADIAVHQVLEVVGSGQNRADAH